MFKCLAQANYVDHCVVMDAFRRLIIGSANEYPVILSVQNLKRSAVDDATNVGVSELQEVVDQTTLGCN